MVVISYNYKPNMSNFNQTFGCATGFDKLPESAFDGHKLRIKLLNKMRLNKRPKDDTQRYVWLDYFVYFGRNFTVEQLQQLLKLTGKQLLERYPYDDKIKDSINLINTPYTMETRTINGVTMQCAVPVTH